MRRLVFFSACILLTGLAGPAVSAAAEESPSRSRDEIGFSADRADPLGTSPYVMSPEQESRYGFDDLMDRSMVLQRVVDTLLSPGKSVRTAYPDGYTGLVANPATMELNVWWSGEVPVEQREQIARAAGDSVAVNYHSDASFSRAELERTIVSHFPTFPEGIEGMSPREDGSAVVVDRLPGATVSHEELERALGVPVIFSSEQVASAPSTVRTGDQSPFKGGASYTNFWDDLCGLGFAVYRGSAVRMLSAAHCDELSSGGGVTNLDGNATIANPGQTFPVREADISIINANAGGASVSTSIYVGGPVANSNSARGINGAYSSDPTGLPVATSGANSGTRLGTIEISATWRNCYGGGNCWKTAIDPVSGQSGVITAGGDSGSPVFTSNSAGTVTYARGVISEGTPTSATSGSSAGHCNGIPRNRTGAVCNKRAYYMPVWRGLDYYNEHYLPPTSTPFRILTE